MHRTDRISRDADPSRPIKRRGIRRKIGNGSKENPEQKVVDYESFSFFNIKINANQNKMNLLYSELAIL